MTLKEVLALRESVYKGDASVGFNWGDLEGVIAIINGKKYSVFRCDYPSKRNPLGLSGYPLAGFGVCRFIPENATFERDSDGRDSVFHGYF